MMLGELITNLKRFNKDLEVYYSNGSSPIYLDSYRGYYDQLALSHESSVEPMKCWRLLELLEDAVDKSFTGYKGGGFIMNLHTDVYVDNYGECSNRIIVDVVEDFSGILIKTTRDNQF